MELEHWVCLGRCVCSFSFWVFVGRFHVSFRGGSYFHDDIFLLSNSENIFGTDTLSPTIMEVEFENGYI